MYSELYPDPYRSSDCSGQGGMWDFMFKDPYAEAKAFYGEEVFRRLYEQTEADRKWAIVRRVADASGRLVDDIAGQVLTR